METRKSQFHLFKERRFLPFFLTQFCGALNDNLFKNALLVMVVSGLVTPALSNTDFVTNLAAGLFILPFFLFSATAGELADKFDKAALIKVIKFVEIVIMATACFALTSGNLYLLLFLLFAMGAQSTFFGPLKYSIIPQHLRPDELLAGNAQVGMGTFVSILLGTLMGSWLLTANHGAALAGSLSIAVAIVGWLASREIPTAPAEAPGLEISLNPVSESLRAIGYARESTLVFNSILGISWFWLFGASLLTQVPNYAIRVLHGEPTLISVLLCAFIVGVASGSLLCNRLSGEKVEPGLIPFGAFGISVFAINFYFASLDFMSSHPSAQPVSPMDFLTSAGGVHILADLCLLGMFGGFYIVPLYAVVQARTDPAKRARVIAANNILNSLFMVLGSTLGILLLGMAGLGIPDFILVLALMNVAIATYVFMRVPEFAMRFLIWLLSHTMYRVSHEGLANIPDKGGAIIVCNHVSYVDALLLAGAIRRPIRFVMYKPIFEIPVLNFIFRTGRAIPICSRHENNQAYELAMERIAQGLDNGDLLCIFPEGKLTTDGKIHEFKTGIERILARNPVPVIPVALRGLWGSFFSHSGPGAFKTPFWRIWSKIQVVAAAPLAATEVSAVELQSRVQQLRGDWR